MNATVSNAIAAGWIRPAGSVVALHTDPKRLAYLRSRREANRAAGLTARGTPRKRPYVWLTGMTEEQKRARRRAQRIAWGHRQRAASALPSAICPQP